MSGHTKAPASTALGEAQRLPATALHSSVEPVVTDSVTGETNEAVCTALHAERPGSQRLKSGGELLGYNSAVGTLLRLIARRNVWSYGELTAALGIRERSELVSLLLTAIENGVICGQIDSEREVFTVHGVEASAQVETEEVQLFLQRLDAWEQRIRRVRSAIQDAKQRCREYAEANEWVIEEPGRPRTANQVRIAGVEAVSEGLLASPVDSDMEVD
ncbi:hypothetical protein CYME_CMO304C [Cyanidioschyzon merolae strain 10D]|jgi:hypothetical protein|uniref:Uncharacterized protein n=1 Tax=Cyanidioschyzon merolae (strain NIES-3377 / 10D) TaxID=280699 RepID=M1V9M9_CYAM1|nr:hypothetical protein CYME_CMO304C [Cyanidioschyzon merolae strain 10D]BAM81634.1 hypothetical protein CYME_CMO304C [Cyanidioschyzon merolae strain 10D]|eukprot:XP_005537670.1 hypothetical protein CYME_CMO304C [Cyanidioschyzon merolae strain 10D]